MQAQTRVLLDALGYYITVVLSAPLNARTVVFYARVTECMAVLCTADYPTYYLQQHISRLLAARLKEGASSALSDLDHHLVKLFQASKVPVSVSVIATLRQESWVSETSPEAAALRVSAA